jgi:predicted 3-demethylubiquinone-9 3-methyltransferase (glyoxalase superfamily)
MTSIVPCIWLDDQAAAAGAFYAKVFPGGRVINTSHYPESADNPGDMPRGSVLTVELELAGQRFTLLNGGPQFKPHPTISFFVNVGTPAEADRIFQVLADGGNVMMALDTYPWSERYGWVADRYGVSWQVTTRPGLARASIVPCLMYTGPQHGKAEEAIRFYTTVFPGARVGELSRYGKGQGAPEGTIVHGTFVLAGQEMVAMDSHVKHEFNFDEGVSLQVMCADQAEIDRFWDKLAEGGRHSACGWLKDRYGVSWQVSPVQMAAWMVSEDTAARDRVFAAMLKMKKLDLAALERAFRGAAS